MTSQEAWNQSSCPPPLNEGNCLVRTDRNKSFWTFLFWRSRNWQGFDRNERQIHGYVEWNLFRDLRWNWLQLDLHAGWSASPHVAHGSGLAEEQISGQVDLQQIRFHLASKIPYLNPLDFYYWGHMKQRIHEGTPRSLMDVKNLIGEFVSTTSGDGDLLKRVTAEFCSRVNRCIQAKGGLFE